MQLIYLIDIFEDNYNIVRDRFSKQNHLNMMKIGSFFERNKVNLNIY